MTKTSNVTDSVSRHPNNINYSFADVVNTNESTEDQYCDADIDEPFTSVPTDKPAETANVDITELDEDECLVLSEVHCAVMVNPQAQQQQTISRLLLNRVRQLLLNNIARNQSAP